MQRNIYTYTYIHTHTHTLYIYFFFSSIYIPLDRLGHIFTNSKFKQNTIVIMDCRIPAKKKKLLAPYLITFHIKRIEIIIFTFIIFKLT